MNIPGVNLQAEQDFYGALSRLALPATIHCRTIPSELPHEGSGIIVSSDEAEHVTSALWRVPLTFIVSSPALPGEQEQHKALVDQLNAFLSSASAVQAAYQSTSYRLVGLWIGTARSIVEDLRLYWQLDCIAGLQVI